MGKSELAGSCETCKKTVYFHDVHYTVSKTNVVSKPNKDGTYRVEGHIEDEYVFCSKCGKNVFVTYDTIK